MSTPALENANRAGVGHWKHFHEIGDRYRVLRVSRIFVRGVVLNVFGLVWPSGVFMLLTHGVFCPQSRRLAGLARLQSRGLGRGCGLSLRVARFRS